MLWSTIDFYLINFEIQTKISPSNFVMFAASNGNINLINILKIRRSSSQNNSLLE